MPVVSDCGIKHQYFTDQVHNKRIGACLDTEGQSTCFVIQQAKSYFGLCAQNLNSLGTDTSFALEMTFSNQQGA